jgi:radical SAM protein with 4Fe4S-binding SPASM domain
MMGLNDKFFICWFETTRRCNMQCSYCMTRREVAADAEELQTEEAKRLVLDEVAKISSNAAVAFSGGEHLLRPDAYELLEYAGKLGIWSFVNTNGRILLETEAIRQAVSATRGKVAFALPLNSIDGDTNRFGRDGALETVLRCAVVCNEAHVPFFFMVTISKSNLEKLRETVCFLRERKVPMLCSLFVPRGAGSAFRHLMVDAVDMEKVIHPALAENPYSCISFTPFFGSPELSKAMLTLSGLRIAGMGCQAARSFAAVSSEGQVAPCEQLLDSSCVCGNVRHEPLSQIVERAPLFAAFRRRTGFKGKCGRCRYRDACGGCRAQAFYHSGDPEAEDPTCFFKPDGAQSHSALEAEQTREFGRFLRRIKTAEPWKNLL